MARRLLQEGIGGEFASDRGGHPVSRDDHGVFGKRAERIERVHQRRHVATGEIGATDGAREEGVAGEEDGGWVWGRAECRVQGAGCRVLEEVADAAGSVSGSRDDRE